MPIVPHYESVLCRNGFQITVELDEFAKRSHFMSIRKYLMPFLFIIPIPFVNKRDTVTIDSSLVVLVVVSLVS